jgi:dUTP pyrophosphatase
MNFQKTHADAVAPAYATTGSAGIDLTAVTKEWKPRQYNEEKNKWVGGYYEYGTGLAFEIPAGHVGILVPRSSTSDTNLSLANCVGIIDSDYRGEVKARYKEFNPSDRSGHEGVYNVGDVVCQLVILPVHRIATFTEVAALGTTERGEGGFGSTDAPVAKTTVKKK